MQTIESIIGEGRHIIDVVDNHAVCVDHATHEWVKVKLDKNTRRQLRRFFRC